MLLKIGVVAMFFSVTFAVGVAVAVATREEPAQRAITAEPVAAENTEQTADRYASPPIPPTEEARPRPERDRPQPETAKPRSEPPPRSKPGPERKPEINPEPVEPPVEPEPLPEPGPQEPLPVAEEDWPGLRSGERDVVKEPRRFELGPRAIMGLTISSIGIHDAPVIDSDGRAALDSGVVHVPETSLPWDGGAQRNVYLAGHRLGYPGTGSRLIFYELDELSRGDEIVLKDRRGRAYRYRVSETFLTGPDDSWVMGQVRGRDMLTLQTCTPIPTFDKRIIVRADRV